MTCGTETCTISSQHLPEIARANLTSLPPPRSLSKSEALAQQQDINPAPQQLVVMGLPGPAQNSFHKLAHDEHIIFQIPRYWYSNKTNPLKKNCSSRTKLTTPKFSENRMRSTAMECSAHRAKTARQIMERGTSTIRSQILSTLDNEILNSLPQRSFTINRKDTSTSATNCSTDCGTVTPTICSPILSEIRS